EHCLNRQPHRVRPILQEIRHAELLGRAVHPACIIVPNLDAHALLVRRLPADGGARF
ncbi:hypothetical protein HJW54_23005, partial [Bacteroides uniformis]|nr:hypothetical protein [Bacteroides uniformis]